MPGVLVSAGEASGDLYAGALVGALRQRDSQCRVIGFGGDRLREAGAELKGDYRGFAVTGLTEAVRVLPRSYAMIRRLVDCARRERPDVLVTIDFPDFNFRLASASVPTIRVSVSRRVPARSGRTTMFIAAFA